MSGPGTSSAASADLDGLRRAPCDPLILAVGLDGRPQRGLTGRVDWRLGGRLSTLIAEGRVPADAPLMLPAPDFFPLPRLVLWRVGAATPGDLARLGRDMAAGSPGLCPTDFGFTAAEVKRAFFGDVVVYTVYD